MIWCYFLSLSHPLFPLPCHKSVLYVCISSAALQGFISTIFLEFSSEVFKIQNTEVIARQQFLYLRIGIRSDRIHIRTLKVIVDRFIIAIPRSIISAMLEQRNLGIAWPLHLAAEKVFCRHFRKTLGILLWSETLKRQHFRVNLKPKVGWFCVYFPKYPNGEKKSLILN